MKVEIVLFGKIRNKVVEKEFPETQLVQQLLFINQNGFFDADCWYPSTRIKEIRFDQPAAPLVNRVFMEDDNE